MTPQAPRDAPPLCECCGAAAGERCKHLVPCWRCHVRSLPPLPGAPPSPRDESPGAPREKCPACGESNPKRIAMSDEHDFATCHTCAAMWSTKDAADLAALVDALVGAVIAYARSSLSRETYDAARAARAALLDALTPPDLGEFERLLTHEDLTVEVPVGDESEQTERICIACGSGDPHAPECPLGRMADLLSAWSRRAVGAR